MDLNPIFVRLLSEGNSLRGIGRILGLTYHNTYRKFLWFKRLVEEHQKSLRFSAEEIQFDELETIHHTKCKPLNLILVLNEKYQLISAKVAEMPAKGRLAEFSRKKYNSITFNNMANFMLSLDKRRISSAFYRYFFRKFCY